MRFTPARPLALLFSLGVLTMTSSPSLSAAPLPALHSRDDHIVNPAGETVILKGCNLGNYLMLEGWMFGGTLQQAGHGLKDGATFYRTLRERFGNERAQQLIDTYREGWIQPRDFELIKSYGFNVVRLPFDYRLIQEETAPYAIKPDAFRWLDHAVDMAEAAGLYTILDLHGVPGGQSREDHTGESGQNKLWDSEICQQRTIDVWRALAEHFKGRTSVAAYDLMNEPYGDHKQDVRPVLTKLMPQITKAVRQAGDDHIVYFPGALNGGIEFYGDPHAAGLTNVAFTEHYYPGLFGSKPAMETQARLLNQQLPAKRAYLQRIKSPYFVGEFNVVQASEDSDRMMRAYYDRFAEYGWQGTMWSYKLLKSDGGAGPGSWYLVTNTDPLPKVDIETSTYAELETFIKAFSAMPLNVHASLHAALTTATPTPLFLNPFARRGVTLKEDEPSVDPAGYNSADIDMPKPGVTSASADGTVIATARSMDIFSTADSFRFVSRPADGALADERATITSMTEPSEWSKAGVMARWGDGAGAAMVMANLFPDGTVALVSRDKAGAIATEKQLPIGLPFPVQLRLKVARGSAEGFYRTDRGEWHSIGTAPVPTENSFRIGLAVCGNSKNEAIQVSACLGDGSDNALPARNDVAAPAIVSLLANSSFDEPGDIVANWSASGAGVSRRPQGGRSGAVMAIDASQPTANLWQDVQATPGDRYVFSIYARREKAGDPQAAAIELRLETVRPDGQITLNFNRFDLSRLPTDGHWIKLTVPATAAGERLRALVQVAGKPVPSASSVLIDDAALSVEAKP